MNEPKAQKVYNAFNRPDAVPAPACREYRETFALKIDDRNLLKPYKTGQYNIRDYINSYAAECDLQVMIKRYLSGDPAFQPNGEGFYGSFDRSIDLQEAINLHDRVKGLYASLDAKVRDKVDYNAFLAAMSNPDLIKEVINKKVDAAKSTNEGETTA